MSVIQKSLTMKLPKQIHVEEAAALRAEFLSAYDRGIHDFDLDFSQVTYIDSAGLGVLVAIHKKAVQSHGGVTIRGLYGQIKELFYMTRLQHVFNIE